VLSVGVGRENVCPSARRELGGFDMGVMCRCGRPQSWVVSRCWSRSDWRWWWCVDIGVGWARGDAVFRVGMDGGQGGLRSIGWGGTGYVGGDGGGASSSRECGRRRVWLGLVHRLWGWRVLFGWGLNCFVNWRRRRLVTVR